MVIDNHWLSICFPQAIILFTIFFMCFNFTFMFIIIYDKCRSVIEKQECEEEIVKTFLFYCGTHDNSRILSKWLYNYSALSILLSLADFSCDNTLSRLATTVPTNVINLKQKIANQTKSNKCVDNLQYVEYAKSFIHKRITSLSTCNFDIVCLLTR